MSFKPAGLPGGTIQRCVNLKTLKCIQFKFLNVNYL